MTKLKYIILFAVITCSCSVYKTHKTPQLNTDNICGENVPTTDTLSTTEQENTPLPWRDIFPDKPLQSLIEKGLTSNTDLLIAQMNIQKGEAALLSSKLAYLPSFALSPQGTIQKAEGASATYSYNLPLTVQWEIDLFGKLRNTKEQARAAMLQSSENAKMVQTQLIASIANNYYTLIMLDEQLRITNATIKNQKENLDVMIALKEAGMQNQAAVDQAEANYYSVMLSEKNLQKQIINVENVITLLINETPHKIARSNFSTMHPINIDYKAPISLIALSNRPDVKTAEYALSNSFYGVNVARAQFYPSIVLSGSAGWTNNLGIISNPGSLLLSAIGSLTQPLFNRGINRANLKIAKLQYEQSLLSFEKALLIAGTEVNDALILCQNSSDKLSLREKQISSSQNALENSKQLMQHSSSTYLEVLIAQNTLLQSSLLYSSDWLEGVQGSISLYKALGGGIK